MISRRKVLMGAGGIAALAAARPMAAFAGKQCSAPIGDRQCVAGLEIGPIETARQRCENWCWAACIQTVFGLYGHSVQQEAAVERLFGQQVCEGADPEQIASTIDGDWVDDNGVPFRARSHDFWLGVLPLRDNDPQDVQLSAYANVGATNIITSLAANRPMIVGAIRPSASIGHAMVLTAAAYEVRSEWYNGSPIDWIKLQKIIVRDPWPDNPNRRELDAEELAGAMFVMGVSVDG